MAVTFVISFSMIEQKQSIRAWMGIHIFGINFKPTFGGRVLASCGTKMEAHSGTKMEAYGAPKMEGQR